MKEDTKLQICRLCLSLIEDETFDIVDDINKEMLAILLPQLNTNVNSNSVLCTVCAENLKKLSILKTDFLNYLSNPTTDKMEQKNQVKCTLCSLMNEEACSVGKNILLKEMLEKCFAGLEVTERTSVCKECLVSLQSLFNFITTCLELEKKIAKYLAKSGDDENNEINLFNVLQSEQVKEGDHFTSSYSNLKLNSVKEETAEFNELISVEDSKINYTEDIKEEPFVGEDDIEIKCDEGEEEKMIYKCDFCNYQSPRKKNLLRHTLIHKKPGEVPMHKCSKCAYQSKRKGDLNQHSLKHKDDGEVYKCPLCHYKTVTKNKLEEHVSKHELLPKKYKCESCPFKAVYKRSLVEHMRTHRIYKCRLCSYETTEKSDLVDKHMPIHTAAYEEMLMLKCPYCDFKVACRNKLDRHILKHKKPEVTMIKCPHCTLGTKQRESLTPHNLIRKTPEERRKFKCDLCSFETKHKHYLKKHVMLHKIKEEKILDCNLCSYKTFLKSNLLKHKRAHFIVE